MPCSARGHCECYNFGLELETTQAKTLDDVTPNCEGEKGGLVFHCECDNLNKTTISVHGSHIVNNAGRKNNGPGG